MTARWSGAVSGIRAAPCGCAPKDGLEVERRRVSHGARSRVSRGDVCHGCSWRETSVVETDSKHLGAVSKERPQGPTRRRVEATHEASYPERGSWSSAARKGARAGKGRKAGAGPSVNGSTLKKMVLDRAQKSSSWKARGVPSCGER